MSKIKIDPRKIKVLPDWAKERLERIAELNQNGQVEEARDLMAELKQSLIITGDRD